MIPASGVLGSAWAKLGWMPTTRHELGWAHPTRPHHLPSPTCSHLCAMPLPKSLKDWHCPRLGHPRGLSLSLVAAGSSLPSPCCPGAQSRGRGL